MRTDPWEDFTLANILTVDEIEQTRGGTAFNAGDLSRNYTRKFRVICDNPNGGASVICSHVLLPRPFSPYVMTDGSEYDLNALMIRSSADLQVPDDRMIWIVTCEYSTQMPDGGPGAPGNTGFGIEDGGSQNNPEMEPWSIEWDSETVTRTGQKDLNGKAFLSSARKPFKPAPSFEVARPILVIQRNQLTFTRETISKYAFAVNSVAFLGAAVGCAQCFPPRGKLMFRGNISYYRTTWRIRFGAPIELASDELETFSPVKILDQDTHRLQDTPGQPDFDKPVPIYRRGTAITDPVLLENGQPLDVSAIDAIPHFQEFDIYKPQNFYDIFTGIDDIPGING